MQRYTVSHLTGGIYYENDDYSDAETLYNEVAKNWLKNNSGRYEIAEGHKAKIHNFVNNITPKPKEYFSAKNSQEFYSKNKDLINQIRRGLKSVPKSSETNVIVKGIKDNSDSFDIAPHNCDIIHRPSIGNCNINHTLNLQAHLATSDKTNEMTKDVLTYFQIL
jgi:hypothetical protein